MGHYSSFIIRLWIEPQAGYRWGIIQHVATRDRRRFSTFAEMLEFIARHSGDDALVLPPDSSAPALNDGPAPDPAEEKEEAQDEDAAPGNSVAGPFGPLDSLTDILAFSGLETLEEPESWREVANEEQSRGQDESRARGQGGSSLMRRSRGGWGKPGAAQG